MQDLAVQSKLTGATISIQLKTLEEWQKLVADGLIMNELSAERMTEISNRITRASEFVVEAVSTLVFHPNEGIMHSPHLDAPTNHNRLK